MLDTDQIQRAAPPGSMRYFALLYTPADKRDLLAALFLIDAEIKTSATAVSHDVAHTRLQWWRAEIDRLINRNAQHPATKLLQQSAPQISFDHLHELMVAADMDLSRMTYNSESEFAVYLDRSGGVLGELAARCLLGVAELDAITREAARSLFAAIRRVETLRDLSMEARAGRIYWAIDELERAHVSIDTLASPAMSDELRRLVATDANRLRPMLATPLNSLSVQTRAALRPLQVLGALHSQLLTVMARANYDIAQRYEVGPIVKVWTAWRAARSV